MKTSQRSQRLSLMALATVGALTLLPQTGWIVRQQAATLSAMLVPLPAIRAIYGNAKARRSEAARHHQDDVAMQIAMAGMDVKALEALQPTYGHSPMLQAAILRALSKDSMSLKGRATDEALLSPPTEKPSVNHETVTPENARLWEQAALAGERRDPTNAFFRFAHATGLFAAHRDREACAEVIRAGELPRDDAYLAPVTSGDWRLLDATNGRESGSLPKLAIQAAISDSFYDRMRSTGRLAVVDAVAREKAGQAESAFEVRRGVERFGARMRTDSSSAIGSLAGAGISMTAMVRPGGAPPLLRLQGETDEQHIAKASSQYVAYVRSIGHSEAVAEITGDVGARRGVRQIVNIGLKRGPITLVNIGGLLACWALGLVLIGNIFFVLLFGGMSAAFSRTKAVRENLPLAPHVTLGVAAAILAGLAWIAIVGPGSQQAYVMDSLFATTLPVEPLSDANSFIPQLFHLLPILTQCIPTLMVLCFFAKSKKARTPAVVGLIRGYSERALPTAIFLVFLFVPLAIATAVWEHHMLGQLQQTNAHEGRTYAGLTGQTWPTDGAEE